MISTDPHLYLRILKSEFRGIFDLNLSRQNTLEPLTPKTTLTVDIALICAIESALAAICVNKERDQVFALTITVLVDGTNSHDVIIHLAENNEVPTEVVDHLSKVRDLLKASGTLPIPPQLSSD